MDFSPKIKWLLGLWLVTTTILMGFLMSTHMGVFKTKSLKDYVKQTGITKNYLHVLYAGCGCSKQVAVRLTQMKLKEGESHTIFWIEDGQTKMPPFPKFINTISLSEDDPRLEQINGAPQLHVYQKEKLVYEGGYSRTKTNFLSEWVMEDLQQGRVPASAPVKGCYIPKKEQTILTYMWKKLI